MGTVAALVIVGGLIALAALAVREGKTGTRPEQAPEISEEDLSAPPAEMPPLAPQPGPALEIPGEELTPPAPELPVASVSIKGVRLTFSKYVSIIPGNVNPQGATFYVVTRIVRPSGEEYGTDRAISLAPGNEEPTMAKLGMDGGNTELAYIKLWIYTKQGGTLVYSRVWWPDELMGPHSPMPA